MPSTFLLDRQVRKLGEVRGTCKNQLNKALVLDLSEP